MAAMTPRPPEWTRTAPVKVSASREMQATADEVFAALADHETWPEWFAALSKVERLGEQAEGVGSKRRVHIGGRVVIDEEFIVWEPGSAWGFTVYESSPRLLKSLNELVTIQTLAPDRVRVTYLMAIDPTRPVGLLLRAGAKRQLKKNLGSALEALGRRLASNPA